MLIQRLLFFHLHPSGQLQALYLIAKKYGYLIYTVLQ